MVLHTQIMKLCDVVKAIRRYVGEFMAALSVVGGWNGTLIETILVIFADFMAHGLK